MLIHFIIIGTLIAGLCVSAATTDRKFDSKRAGLGACSTTRITMHVPTVLARCGIISRNSGLKIFTIRSKKTNGIVEAVARGNRRSWVV